MLERVLENLLINDPLALALGGDVVVWGMAVSALELVVAVGYLLWRKRLGKFADGPIYSWFRVIMLLGVLVLFLLAPRLFLGWANELREIVASGVVCARIDAKVGRAVIWNVSTDEKMEERPVRTVGVPLDRLEDVRTVLQDEGHDIASIPLCANE